MAVCLAGLSLMAARKSDDRGKQADLCGLSSFLQLPLQFVDPLLQGSIDCLLPSQLVAKILIDLFEATLLNIQLTMQLIVVFDQAFPQLLHPVVTQMFLRFCKAASLLLPAPGCFTRILVLCQAIQLFSLCMRLNWLTCPASA